jgi:serine/threonine protein kinase
VSEDSTLPPPGLPERSVVAGKYRLTRLLGRGGMGTVWEAVHETLGTRVAVKLIENDELKSRDSWRRFENEARAAARLQSKHVVEVYDHGVTDDGRAFIVMQYLQGEPLDRRLERLLVLSPEETVRTVLQVCRALSKAHALGIVHRDLKPENIFLVWDDEDGADIVKVVDFGIAKVTQSTSETASTRSGSVLGTPFYMSPEQARGLRTVDHRSDLWSVGVIAFRCVVGSLPFEGESVGDVLVKVCTAPIPVPSTIVHGLPPTFDAWIERALSRDVSARFSSASELAESLAAVWGMPIRSAYATGDIPIRSFPDGEFSPTITPRYPPNVMRSMPTLQSRDAEGDLPENPTGDPITRTPSPAPLGKKSPIVIMALLGLLLIGGVVAALTRWAPGETEKAATAPSVPFSPAPASAPIAATAVPAPVPPVAPSASLTAGTAVEAAPSASTLGVRPRVGTKAPVRSTAPASSKAPPSLDIRLQR